MTRSGICRKGGDSEEEGTELCNGASEAAARDLECLEGVNDESQRQEHQAGEILYREGGFGPG